MKSLILSYLILSSLHQIKAMLHPQGDLCQINHTVLGKKLSVEVWTLTVILEQSFKHVPWALLFNYCEKKSPKGSSRLSSGEGKVGVKWRESKWHLYFWHTKLPAHWNCISFLFFFFLRSVFLSLWSSNAEHNHLLFLHPTSCNHTQIFSVKSSHTLANEQLSVKVRR